MTGIEKSKISCLTWIKLSFFAVLILSLFVVAAVPWNIGVTRPDHEENAARSALHYVSMAQEPFQALGAKDADGDGIGEYGNFTELAGGSSSVNLKKPILPPRFTNVDENGYYKSINYYFRIIVGGKPVAEAPGDGCDEPACSDALNDSAEKYWICYAWPVCKAKGRSKAFYCTQDGIVMQSSDYITTDSHTVPVTGSWTPCK